MFKAISGSLLLVAVLSLPFPVRANVIYNVTFDVTSALGSSTSAVYSFSMEFLDSNSSKTQADLISASPANDFTNERLVVDGVQWTLLTDGAVTSLSFDPGTLALTFTSADVFETVSGGIRYTTTSGFNSAGFPSYRCEYVNPLPGQGSCGVQGIRGGAVPTVNVSNGTVPAPSVLALLAIGLPGLWLRARNVRGLRALSNAALRAAR